MTIRGILQIIWAIFFSIWLFMFVFQYVDGYAKFNEYQLYMILLTFVPLIPQWILPEDILNIKIFGK